MTKRWSGAIVLITTAAATLLAREQPLPSVTVHVTSFETGRPVPNARLAFGEDKSDAFHSGTTDAKGTVVFSAQRPARYRIDAGASGYLSTGFGRQPGLGDTLVALDAGHPPVDVTIALHRGSTIAGVVTNDLKEPVVGADVRATSQQSLGDIRYPAGGSAKTDDRGVYRIIGLAAGQYFVSAADGLSVAFATRAGTPNVPRAISIGVDEEQAGVNIQTKPSPAGTISGSIAGPGAGAPGMSVLLMQDAADAGFSRVGMARVEPGARFTFTDVPVGRYVLIVRPGTGQAQPRAWGRTPVIVVAHDEAIATVALHPGGRISGTVAAPAGARGSVEIAPLGTDHPEAAAGRSMPGGAGSFSIPNIAPARYRWMPATLLSWGAEYVLSAFVNDQDVTDVPLEAAPDVTVENVRVTITPAARVSGTVTDAVGKPTSRGAVIIASTSARDWTEATRRIRLARPDTAGFYEISGLPAGVYTVSTVTALVPGQLWDPAFLKTLAKSRQITLTQGQTATVDLRLK